MLVECFLMFCHRKGSEWRPTQKNDTMNHPPCSVWHGNSMMHTKIITIGTTKAEFWFRKHVQICETIHVKRMCKSSKSDCMASRKPFLYRKRPPQQNGDRRKRHSSSAQEWGHSGLAWGDCVSQAAQAEWCYQGTPPLSHSTFPWAEISDFQEKRLKSMTASF